MIVRKTLFSSAQNEVATLRIIVETQRELDLLEAMFKNTYYLHDVVSINSNEDYTHAEIKAAADAIYIAIVTKP